ADLIMGLSPKGSSYNMKGEGIPLLNGAADFSGNKLIPKKYTTNPTRVCQKGDILFCIRATIGNVTFADKSYCIGRGVAAIRPKKIEYKEFCYYQILGLIKKLTNEAAGSVIGGISKDDIKEIKFPFSENIVNEF